MAVTLRRDARALGSAAREAAGATMGARVSKQAPAALDGSIHDVATQPSERRRA